MKRKESDVEARLDKVEAELEGIKKIYKKTLKYANSDPEVSLQQARKAAEAICREVFKREISKNVGRLTLDDLITKLVAKEKIPRHIQVPLRTIQGYGNYAAHDQDDWHVSIDETYIQPALKSLATVTDWFFSCYSERPFTVPEAIEIDSHPTAGESKTNKEEYRQLLGELKALHNKQIKSELLNGIGIILFVVTPGMIMDSTVGSMIFQSLFLLLFLFFANILIRFFFGASYQKRLWNLLDQSPLTPEERRRVATKVSRWRWDTHVKRDAIRLLQKR